MRIVTALALTVLMAATTPALAQTAAPAPAAAPAAAPAFSADTPLEKVVADPAAKAVLDKDLPTISSHPAFEQFKGMSLRELQPYAQGKLTDEAIAKADADLKAIAAK